MAAPFVCVREEGRHAHVMHDATRDMMHSAAGMRYDARCRGAMAARCTMLAVPRQVAREERSNGRLSEARVSHERRLSVADTHDLVKIVLVGDSGTGKSCLMVRFVKGEFVTSTRATIGMDFATRQIPVSVMHASEQSVVSALTVQVRQRGQSVTVM